MRAREARESSVKSDLSVPHFLRVTQALALVSGFGLPIAAGCGGSTFSSSSGTESDSGGSETASSDDGSVGQPAPGGGGVNVPYDGAVLGVIAHPFDGGPTGVIIAYEAGGGGISVPYDGSVTGVAIYDGGPTGVQPYDGAVTGVAIYDGGPLGIIVPLDGGHVLAGGPLLPPELPA